LFQESYPLDLRLHDFAVAQRHDRELLELKSYTVSGLRRIHNAAERYGVNSSERGTLLYTNLQRLILFDHSKYIVKSTAMKQSMPGTFTTNTNSALEFYCLLKFAVQSDEWSEDPRAVCEIMFDLSDYITNPAHTKLIICRPINRTPYFCKSRTTDPKRFDSSSSTD
jgi:hypothetical protein